MVILSRKTAGQNPASTAALRRVAISLSSQRRALRHPAGAVQKASSSPAEMRKRIRQEVMNGTFAQGTRVGRRYWLATRIASTEDSIVRMPAHVEVITHH